MDLLNEKMANRWVDILQQGAFIGGINAQPVAEVSGVKSVCRAKRPPLSGFSKRYVVGGALSSVEFTRREAECMVWILRGYTNCQIAECMGLSSRTVEYYIKNMRAKVGAHSKLHLMKVVLATDFLSRVDFM